MACTAFDTLEKSIASNTIICLYETILNIVHHKIKKKIENKIFLLLIIKLSKWIKLQFSMQNFVKC